MMGIPSNNDDACVSEIVNPHRTIESFFQSILFSIYGETMDKVCNYQRGLPFNLNPQYCSCI